MIEKTKFYFYLCFWGLCTYLWLNQETITILTVLIFIDIITWIIKSVRLWKDVTSKIGAVWVLSKLILILVPITVALVWKWAWIDLTLLVTFTFSMFIVSEWYSIIWNITSIITKQKIKEMDAISKILWVILKTFRNFLENWINWFKK